MKPHQFDKLKRIRKKHKLVKTKPKKVKKRRCKKHKPNSMLDIKLSKTKGMSYSDFLNSKYWKVVRKIILDRDNNKCVLCRCNKQLQVHHNTYRIRGDEHNNLDELTTLCRSCHYEYHLHFTVK